MTKHGENKIWVHDPDAQKKFYEEWGKKHPVEYAKGSLPAPYFVKRVTIDTEDDDDVQDDN